MCSIQWLHSEINNTQIDNAKDFDVVMPVYSSIKCSNSYSKHQEVYCNIIELS